MMVVGSNLIGIVTVPFMLHLVLRGASGVKINAVGEQLPSPGCPPVTRPPWV